MNVELFILSWVLSGVLIVFTATRVWKDNFTLGDMLIGAAMGYLAVLCGLFATLIAVLKYSDSIVIFKKKE